MAVYVVQPGDSLSKIAKKLGISNWRDLYNLNKKVIGPNPNLIKVGQKLTYGSTPKTTTAKSTASAGTTAGKSATKGVPTKAFSEVMPWEQFFDPTLAQNAIAQRTARYFDPLVQQGRQSVESDYAGRGLTRSSLRSRSVMDMYRDMADQEATMREQLYGQREGEAKEDYRYQQGLYEKDPTGYKAAPASTGGYTQEFPEESAQRYSQSYRDWLRSAYKI